MSQVMGRPSPPAWWPLAGSSPHRFGMDDLEQAYDVFGDAASGALKVSATREEEEE